MFKSHGVVNHGIGEYVRGEDHTNTVEGYFSILKRGVIGTFHHVSPQHLKRYVCEFDYRYNTRTALGFTDAERFHLSIPGIVGKRLTYRRAGGWPEAAKPVCPAGKGTDRSRSALELPFDEESERALLATKFIRAMEIVATIGKRGGALLRRQESEKPRYRPRRRPHRFGKGNRVRV